MTIFYGLMAAIGIAGACFSGSCIIIAGRKDDKARITLGVISLVFWLCGTLGFAALLVKEVLK